MNKRLFTIILCTYNGSRTLKKSIDKVVTQSHYDEYVGKFVVVDNASKDNTKEIVLSYGDKVVYSYEPVPGLGNARLNGVNLTDTPWIVFIDDDNELDSNWIYEAANYIKRHEDVFIFGGSIIPKLDFAPSSEEKEVLENCFRMLACSNLARTDIDFKANSGPIVGAGMVVRTSCLNELKEDGWLTLCGRVGKNCASGEDSEIVHYITQVKRLKSGFCPSMIMEHNLPQSRLQKEYIKRLNIGISLSGFELQSMSSFYLLRRLKSIFKILVSGKKHGNPSLKNELEEDAKKEYMKYILSKKLVRR